MAKIGIRKIKIAKKGEVSDSFFDTSGLAALPFNKFNEIEFVQSSASLTDEIIDDENGTYHVINLDFSTRKELNHWKALISSFIEIPVIILVISVDGNNYVIGSNKAPAYITTHNKYQKIDSRELHISCIYKNKSGLQSVSIKHISIEEDYIEEQIAVDQSVIRCSWQGGSGTIAVSTTQKWNVKPINN